MLAGGDMELASLLASDGAGQMPAVTWRCIAAKGATGLFHPMALLCAALSHHRLVPWLALVCMIAGLEQSASIGGREGLRCALKDTATCPIHGDVLLRGGNCEVDVLVLGCCVPEAHSPPMPR